MKWRKWAALYSYVCVCVCVGVSKGSALVQLCQSIPGWIGKSVMVSAWSLCFSLSQNASSIGMDRWGGACSQSFGWSAEWHFVVAVCLLHAACFPLLSGPQPAYLRMRCDVRQLAYTRGARSESIISPLGLDWMNTAFGSIGLHIIKLISEQNEGVLF